MARPGKALVGNYSKQSVTNLIYSKMCSLASRDYYYGQVPPMRAGFYPGFQPTPCAASGAEEMSRAGGAKKKKKASKASQTKALSAELIARARSTIVTALAKGYTIDRIFQFLHLKEGYPMAVLQAIAQQLAGKGSRSRSRSRPKAKAKPKARKRKAK